MARAGHSPSLRTGGYPDCPVTKEELFASVWNETVVSDDALTSCIQELRRAVAIESEQERLAWCRHRRMIAARHNRARALHNGPD